MLAPFVNLHVNNSFAIPLAVLGASLLGSGHCVGMCGGLMFATVKNKKDILSYHFGRLIGYSSLGALAGALGQVLFQNSSFQIIQWISSILLASFFIYFGIQIWSGKSLHLFRIPQSFWNKLRFSNAGMIGFFSTVLPCGWLHAFILGAVATQDTVLGALYLFFFWLGTLPALSFAPFLATKIFKPIATRIPKLSAIFLIFIGIGSIGVKLLPLSPSKDHHCNHLDHPMHEKIDAKSISHHHDLDHQNETR